MAGMIKHFQNSKNLNTLAFTELRNIADGATVFIGRPMYQPVTDYDILTFLETSKIDRYIWRTAQPDDDSDEMVCTSFSLLLWALIEQERLRSGIKYPLAVARVTLLQPGFYEDGTPGDVGHSVCGFVNDQWKFKLIEPQTDEIYAPRENQQILGVMFQ